MNETLFQVSSVASCTSGRHCITSRSPPFCLWHVYFLHGSKEIDIPKTVWKFKVINYLLEQLKGITVPHTITTSYLNLDEMGRVHFTVKSFQCRSELFVCTAELGPKNYQTPKYIR